MNDEGTAFWAGVFLTAIVLIVLFSYIASVTDDSWRRQITEHHAAEYYLDANHDRQWRWTQ